MLHLNLYCDMTLLLSLQESSSSDKHKSKKNKKEKKKKSKSHKRKDCSSDDSTYSSHRKHKKSKRKHSKRKSRTSDSINTDSDKEVITKPVGKSMAELRAERLKREQTERLRTSQLLKKVLCTAEDNTEEVQDKQEVEYDDRKRGYNSQFNPHLIRRPRQQRDEFIQ
jgi:hypothetical protein